jgi:hypothetical protein
VPERAICTRAGSGPEFRSTLRRDTARVLYAWLARTDLNRIPMEHKAEKQAFTDLFAWLESDCDGPYISAEEMARAHDEILLAPNARDEPEFCLLTSICGALTYSSFTRGWSASIWGRCATPPKRRRGRSRSCVTVLRSTATDHGRPGTKSSWRAKRSRATWAGSTPICRSARRGLVRERPARIFTYRITPSGAPGSSTLRGDSAYSLPSGHSVASASEGRVPRWANGLQCDSGRRSTSSRGRR